MFCFFFFFFSTFMKTFYSQNFTAPKKSVLRKSVPSNNSDEYNTQHTLMILNIKYNVIQTNKQKKRYTH
uniref:Putative secreted protein ovary overexpressed n=1 Tax=Rhipicephalus microplus TaxID=6941 RepID=A0A6M2DBB5_RHIMP